MSGLKRIKARVKKPGVRAYRVGQLVDVLKFGEKGFVDFPKNYSTGRVIKITTRLHVTFNGPGHMAYDASDRRAGDDLHWATYHSAAYRGIAIVLALDGKSAEERVWRDKDAALWESWNRKLPRNVFVLHQLAGANAKRD
jgi:hypothetical protein